MNYYIQPAENYSSQGTLAKLLIGYINDNYAQCVVSQDTLEDEVIADIQLYAAKLNRENPRCKSTSARVYHPEHMEGARIIVDAYSIICKPVKKIL